MTPLLLLDVDGVLNALDRRDDRLRRGWATAEGNPWPIAFDPAVVERLRRWDDEGLVEVQWLTTWGHDANGDLGELLGTPQWPVAGTYRDEPYAGDERPGGDTLAGATPSAPDLLAGRWWKHDVVRRLLVEHPRRRIVWVDDELTDDSPFTEWAAQQRIVLPVGPHPDTGLVEPDLERVEAWLALEPCGRCGAPLLPVAMGYPSMEMFSAAARGELLLGGCIVDDARDRFACPRCR